MKTTLMSTALLAALAGTLGAQEGETGDPRKEEIVNRLDSVRLTLDFKETALDDVLSYLRETGGLNIVLDPEVAQKASPADLKITLRVKDLTLKSCLKLLLGSRDLTATYRDGVLVVIPKGRTDKNVYYQLYDVRDLLVKIQDFAGPKVELISPTKGASAGPVVGASFTFDDPKTTITEDFLTEMIKTNTGDQSWSDNPNASIALTNGMLVVSQSRRVHGEIKNLINLMRQFK